MLSIFINAFYFLGVLRFLGVVQNLFAFKILACFRSRKVPFQKP